MFPAVLDPSTHFFLVLELEQDDLEREAERSGARKDTTAFKVS